MDKTKLVVGLAGIAVSVAIDVTPKIVRLYKNRAKTQKMQRSKLKPIENSHHIVITLPAR
jgi:hypothetical protein